MDATNLQVDFHDVLNYDGRFEKLQQLLRKERTRKRDKVKEYNDVARLKFSDVSTDDAIANSIREGSCISSASNALKKNCTQRNARESADQIMMPPPSSDRRILSPVMSWSTRAQDSEKKITASLVNIESCSRKVGKYLSVTPQCSPEQILGNCADVELASRGTNEYTVSIVESSATLNVSKQDGRTFDKWTINLNRADQIVIKGRLECKKFVRSKPIARRLDDVTLLSITGHKYRLIGSIDDNHKELPVYIRTKFYHGFPPDWENVHRLWRSYVNGGCQPNFKWPETFIDTDDDCSTVSTDITSIRTAAEVQNLPISSRESKKSVSRKTQQHNSGISIDSNMLLDQAPCTHINTNISTPSLDNHLINDVEQMKALENCPVQLDAIDSLKGQDLISRNTVDTICSYLEDIKCPYSYIGTIVRSIDCINHIAALAFMHQNNANNFQNEARDQRNTVLSVDPARLPTNAKDGAPSTYSNRVDNCSENRDSREYDSTSRKAYQKSARRTVSNQTSVDEQNRYQNTSSPVRVPRNLGKIAYSTVDAPELRSNIDEDVTSRQFIEKGRNSVTKTVSPLKRKIVLDAPNSCTVSHDSKQTRRSSRNVNFNRVVDDEIPQRSATETIIVTRAKAHEKAPRSQRSCVKKQPIIYTSSSDESTHDEIDMIFKKRGRSNSQTPKSFHSTSKQIKTSAPKFQKNCRLSRSLSMRPTVLLMKIDEQYNLKNFLRSEKPPSTNDLNQESSWDGTVKPSPGSRVGSPPPHSNDDRAMYKDNRTVSNTCSASKYEASSNSANPKYTSIGTKFRSVSKRRLDRKDEHPITIINNRLEIDPNSDSSSDSEYLMQASGGFRRNWFPANPSNDRSQAKAVKIT